MKLKNHCRYYKIINLPWADYPSPALREAAH